MKNNTSRFAVLALASVALITARAQMMYPMPKEVLDVTGGWVLKPGTQKGEIAYVNCQSTAKAEWIKESVDYFIDMTVFNITLKSGTFDLKNPAVQGNVSIFIVDDPGLPMSLIAPEAGWGLVNVAKLKSDKEPFFRARVKKELSRVFAMVCGGYKSNYPGNLTDAIRQPKDLDSHMNAELPVDVLARFPVYLKPYGITPAIVSTYLDACGEGWAASPTNDVQKKIWNQAHAIPDQPIKIKKQK